MRPLNVEEWPKRAADLPDFIRANMEPGEVLLRCTCDRRTGWVVLPPFSEVTLAHVRELHRLSLANGIWRGYRMFLPGRIIFFEKSVLADPSILIGAQLIPVAYADRGVAFEWIQSGTLRLMTHSLPISAIAAMSL